MVKNGRGPVLATMVLANNKQLHRFSRAKISGLSNKCIILPVKLKIMKFEFLPKIPTVKKGVTHSDNFRHGSVSKLFLVNKDTIRNITVDFKLVRS